MPSISLIARQIRGLAAPGEALKIIPLVELRPEREEVGRAASAPHSQAGRPCFEIGLLGKESLLT